MKGLILCCKQVLFKYTILGKKGVAGSPEDTSVVHVEESFGNGDRQEEKRKQPQTCVCEANIHLYFEKLWRVTSKIIYWKITHKTAPVLENILQKGIIFHFTTVLSQPLVVSQVQWNIETKGLIAVSLPMNLPFFSLACKQKFKCKFKDHQT